MKASTIQAYANLAEQERVRRSRDFQVDDGERPMTMGWIRYHPQSQLVPVRDAWGNTRMLTPNQHKILIAARSLEGERVTMTIIANSLGFAVSTVSRAMTRLAAFGLVAFDAKRGKGGGVSILETAWADLRARSRQAWMKIRRECEKVHERYIRKLDESLYWWAGLEVATNTPVVATYT